MPALIIINRQAWHSRFLGPHWNEDPGIGSEQIFRQSSGTIFTECYETSNTEQESASSSDGVSLEINPMESVFNCLSASTLVWRLKRERDIVLGPGSGIWRI